VPVFKKLGYNTRMPISHPKIVATLGPCTQSPDLITALIGAGATVIRLNFSHGDHANKVEAITMVRSVAQQLNRSIALLGDLQGPKIRTGKLLNAIPWTLEMGQEVRFTRLPVLGEPGLISTPNVELLEHLAPGHRILINDGRLQLDVFKRLDDDTVMTVVTRGGDLSERKGINLPDTPLPNVSAVTDKDRDDLQFCLLHDVEYVALSFVRNSADIVELKTLIRHLHGDHPLPSIIAKIEKPEALTDIDNIVQLADGLMVARGDLGVELSYDQVPIVQKQLVNKANQAGKPVIIATQMLESMITAPTPTRAEASDVANALLDGADALMLSQETAMGQYPIEAVSVMRQIMASVESSIERVHAFSLDFSGSESVYDALAHAACYTAAKTQITTIVVLSASGRFAQRVSKLKPLHCQVIALTSSERVARMMSLFWGVTPLIIPPADTTEDTLSLGQQIMLQQGLVTAGQTVIFCAGKTPLAGASHMIKVMTI
jgi:pyruvate kinase